MADDTNNLVVRDHDGEWAESVWAPRVIRAGFKYWAIALPKAAIGKLNMKRFAEAHRKRGVEASVVTDPEAAFKWLKSF